MANLTVSNLTNVTMKGEAKYVFSVIILCLTIIINVIACPFTIGLNVLVIMAIKRRPRLQNNSNIMLACLAVTDVLTGLTTQPSYVLWQTLFLLGNDTAAVFSTISGLSINVLTYSSALHLMMVVGEKLIAIKYPFWYPYIVTTRNIKMGVVFCWAYGSSFGIPIRLMDDGRSTLYYISASHILFACIFFVCCSYIILFFKTRRHQKMIKAQQLPQEQVETFLKENKALKTTVLVVGALGLCLFPAFVYLVLLAGRFVPRIDSITIISRTLLMINSILNPLIYCWRQEEIRKFVFRTLVQVSGNEIG